MNTAQPSPAPKQIVILGGGFAGVYTARYLEKLLRPDQATITLVNRENYWVYQPMLSEVISGSIGLANVVSPIRRLCRHTNLVTREIEDIDLANKVVTVSPGFRPRQLKLHYDYLVIALGNVTNFYGMPGMLENAMPFKTLADAMVLRNHVIRTLEEADVEEDPELRRKLLTFVVGGGGFSGVEVIAELNDFVRAVKGNYLRLRNEPHRAVLVHSRNRILQEMAEPLALFAQKTLRKRGVEIILEDRLVAATSEKAILKSGVEIHTKTIVCTVPSTLPPVIQKLDCAKDKGKLADQRRARIEGLRRAGLGPGRLHGRENRFGQGSPAHRAARHSGSRHRRHQYRRHHPWRPARAVRVRRLGNARIARPRRSGGPDSGREAVGLDRLGPVALHLSDEDARPQSQGAHRVGLDAALAIPARSRADQTGARIGDSEPAFRARRRGVPAGRSGRQRLRDRGRRVRRFAGQGRLTKACSQRSRPAIISARWRCCPIKAATRPFKPAPP